MKLATTLATRRVAAVVTAAVVILVACSDPEAPDPNPDPKTPVAFVTVSPTTLALVAGQSHQLTATTRDHVNNVITGRAVAWETTIGRSRRENPQLRADTTRAAFVALRESRDAALTAPRLLYPSVQINLDGGRLPPAHDNGRRYLSVPIFDGAGVK